MTPSADRYRWPTLALVPPEHLALADRVRRLPPAKRDALFARLDAELGPEAIASLRYAWDEYFARPDQIVPRDWRGPLVVFGGPRGDGKTEAAIALWHREILEGRSVMPRFFCATEIDLEKMVMKRIRPSLPPHLRPEWVSTSRLLIYPNEITAQGYAASALESSVGDEGDLDLYDDVAKWGHNASMSWKHARTSCRYRGPMGARGIVATTRRGNALLKKLLEGEVAEVRRAPYPLPNRYNVAPDYYRRQKRELGGDDFYLQELEDEDISEASPFFGLAFEAPPIRIAVAGEVKLIAIPIDPADGKGRRNDEWGIGAMGKRVADRHVVALEDASGSHDDAEAGAVIIDLWERWAARYPSARIVFVAENNRGPRVMTAIRAAHLQRELERLALDPDAAPRALPEIVSVKSEKTKPVRAQQVKPLYVSGLLHHVAGLEQLERQQREWDPTAPPRPKQDDRIDWLMLGAHYLADLGGKQEPEPGPWTPGAGTPALQGRYADCDPRRGSGAAYTIRRPGRA